MFTTRRQFLENTGKLVLNSGISGALFSPAVAALLEKYAKASLSDDPTIEALSRSFRGRLLVQTSEGYPEHKGGFNLNVPASPYLVAMCTTPQDVALVIAWARENEVQIRMRSGGHSYEGFSWAQVGNEKIVVIDVGAMNQVSVDSEGIATIGAGARLGPVAVQLWDQGHRILPTGSCPTVGVSGLALGGGHGLLSRMYGLTCDSLTEVQMVMANGTTLTANEFENPDLFWACRGGGGGNFGVVTLFKFKTYAAPRITRYKIKWDESQTVNALEAWQRWLPLQSSNMNSIFRVTALHQEMGAPSAFGLFVGTENECEAALESLADQVESSDISTHVTDYMSAARLYWGGEDPDPVYFKATSDYVKSPLTSDSIRTLLSNAEAYVPQGAAVALLFDGYGGAISNFTNADTAFAHRDALYCIQYYSEWTNPRLTASRVRMVQNLYDSNASLFPNRSAYVNYCDLRITDWQSAYHGENYARLTRVKSQYDPGNIFTHAQGIERG